MAACTSDSMRLLGPLVLYVGYAQSIIEDFFVLNSLIVAGRSDAESVLRTASLQARIACLLVDLAWSATYPRALPASVVAICAALSAAASAFRIAWAFGVVGSGAGISPAIATALYATTTLAMIPAAQYGRRYTLTVQKPAARYKIFAWLTQGVGSCALFSLPQLTATPVATIVFAALPPLAVAGMFWMTGDVSARNPAPGSQPGESDAAGRVSPRGAAIFLGCGCLCGTTAEALNDMAVNLTVRDALGSGDKRLAVAYDAAVMAANVLALATESQIDAGGQASSSRRRCLAAHAWSLCQLLRCVGMPHLTPSRVWLLALFVFGDKYAGPLGGGAVDAALLSVLRRGATAREQRFAPRAAALWSARIAVERMERPVCQLLLLHFGSGAAAWLPAIFALSTSTFVQLTMADSACAARGSDIDGRKRD